MVDQAKEFRLPPDSKLLIGPRAEDKIGLFNTEFGNFKMFAKFAIDQNSPEQHRENARNIADIFLTLTAQHMVYGVGLTREIIAQGLNDPQVKTIHDRILEELRKTNQRGTLHYDENLAEALDQLYPKTETSEK